MSTSKVLPHPSVPRVTVPVLLAKKPQGEKITALTAYDFPTAELLDDAGIDIILIGDSLGTVFQGLDTTLPVTLDEMLYHSRCVSRAVKRALVVGDMPFLSYQISPEKALESAGRFIKEGGVAAVKLEGGENVAPIIERLTKMDIQVMGHVGMTPQSYHRMGGFKVQGRSNPDQVMLDALAVQESGAFSVVLEGIPDDLAAEITAKLQIPTIGIGAGTGCDGQILVTQDMLGLHGRQVPKFVKRYADLYPQMHDAITNYVREVKAKSFPSSDFSYGRRKNG